MALGITYQKSPDPACPENDGGMFKCSGNQFSRIYLRKFRFFFRKSILVKQPNLHESALIFSHLAPTSSWVAIIEKC